MLPPKPPWLQALFPWEHKALRVNGRTMAYLDEGPPEARPVLLPWADSDPITGAWEEHVRSIFQHVAPPLPIAHAGHFLQEDAGEEIAGHIRDWLLQTRR